MLNKCVDEREAARVSEDAKGNRNQKAKGRPVVAVNQLSAFKKWDDVGRAVEWMTNASAASGRAPR